MYWCSETSKLSASNVAEEQQKSEAWFVGYTREEMAHRTGRSPPTGHY